jgi:hypothetical protein
MQEYYFSAILLFMIRHQHQILIIGGIFRIEQLALHLMKSKYKYNLLIYIKNLVYRGVIKINILHMLSFQEEENGNFVLEQWLG